MSSLRRNTVLLLASLLALAFILGAATQVNAQYDTYPNPSLTAGCGLDVVLVLDSSGSINSYEAQQVRTASLAFVSALAGTGSRVALVEFAATARLGIGYIDASAAYTSFNNYLYGVYKNGSLGSTTNWQAAFDMVNNLNPAPDLVLLMTDGEPTAGSPTPLQGAINSSNITKQRGSHIFALGIGIVGGTPLDNLKAILNGPGSVAYDGTNFPVADYTLGTFDTLLDDLTGVTYELCAPSLTVNKLVDRLDGQGYQPAGDWEFSGRVTAEGGFDWVSPLTPDGDGRKGNTDADGALTFQWNTTDPQAASTIEVTETPVEGYDFVDVVCEVKSLANPTPAPLAVVVNGASFEANLGPDDIVTCEVRNLAQPATIVIEKSTVPADGTGFNFTSDIPGGLSFSLDDGQSQIFNDLAAGTYAVSEDDPGSLYALQDLTCTDPDGGSTVDLGTRTATIDLDAGETVTCSFTNQRQTGTVVIEKLADGPDGEVFGFFTSIDAGGGGFVDFDLVAGDSIEFADILVGSHTVGEYNPGPLYALTGLLCDDPDGETTVDLFGHTAQIDLDPQETVTCTFTNKRQTGTVIVEKATTPAGGTGFAFATDIGSDGGGDSEFYLDDGGSHLFSDVLAGSHYVTEFDLPNHQLIGLECEDPSGDSQIDLNSRTASIELAVDETVTCTFTNQRLTGTVVIEKLTNTGLGTGFTFNTDILGGGGGYADFDLDAGESVVFSDVPVGSHEVIEYDPGPGYELASLTCDDPGGDSVANTPARMASIELSPGETVTCTFTNNDLPPVAEAGGPYSGLEGTPMALDGSGSNDSLGIVLYEWDCTDDGTYDVSSANPSDSACVYPTDGLYTVRLRVTDTGNQTDQDTADVTIANAAPEITALSADPAVIDEDETATVSGSFSDPSPSDSHTVVIQWGDGSPNTVLNLTNGERDFDAQHQYLDDDPTGTTSDTYPVAVSVTDEGGDSDEADTSVTVNNVAPDLGAISVDSPSLVIALGEAIGFRAVFTDPGTLDTHTATWDWGDGTTPGTISEAGGSGEVADTHSYDTPGVYAISLELADDDLGSDTATFGDYVVVYDPDGGFVTGGGWIWSQPGWCQLDELCAGAEGKANFGFVSKYQRGAQVPTGDTEFNFAAGGLNFHSDSYEWLVVNQNGENAQFKGNGTINGQLAPTGELYGFMIWAKDLTPGSDDTFRVKIWYQEAGLEVVVYDNGFDQAIGGGSIVIHTGKGN